MQLVAPSLAPDNMRELKPLCAVHQRVQIERTKNQKVLFIKKRKHKKQSVKLQLMLVPGELRVRAGLKLLRVTYYSKDTETCKRRRLGGKF